MSKVCLAENDFGLSTFVLVAAEGVEPSSLDYREGSAVELHRGKRVQSLKSKVQSLPGWKMTLDFGPWTLDLVLVDPTGLEPAPYGLKVRYSATRVPGHYEGKCPKSKIQCQ